MPEKRVMGKGKVKVQVKPNGSGAGKPVKATQNIPVKLMAKIEPKSI